MSSFFELTNQLLQLFIRRWLLLSRHIYLSVAENNSDRHSKVWIKKLVKLIKTWYGINMDASRNPFKKFFNKDRIGTGSHFVEGDDRAGPTARKFGKGLSGDFYKAKWTAAGTKRNLTKNLSKEDVNFIDKLVGHELRALPKNASGLTRWQGRKLKLKVYRAFKRGKTDGSQQLHLSKADVNDARNIIEALGDKHLDYLREGGRFPRGERSEGEPNNFKTNRQRGVLMSRTNDRVKATRHISRLNTTSDRHAESFNTERPSNRSTGTFQIRQQMSRPKLNKKEDPPEMNIG
ncbi:hypothetical protein COV04_02980 [Candidatus Uhrbacteria bacterium CG10_big_fil_rev_8_21_14_0_10_48_11]|uniref:Uncharacterized protein n=1 Tax=Candidatus Uhrbacteria bacterium CG10_big_fil_rev_8_21_14_0_10_48_11 TaxID=1975037 RepID=A0A2M8LEK0_9BACT|nr:MAG: hypothetical protein COV04_02980 [Candidatus Uhrbacteria bacterium CG10_big_fil_rev_8_21_14_0_10_48_11]